MGKQAKIEQQRSNEQLYNWVLLLALFTILYNIAEGIIAMYFGIKEEALTLFGFGADSFVETISAIGILQMVLRIRNNPNSDKGKFEILALKITGWCFYALAVLLTVSAIYNLIEGNVPNSTFPGVIIAGISILIMWAMIRAKISLGTRLNSPSIVADAKCNQVCLYMSLILLVASGLWYVWKLPYVDAVGAMGLVYFSIREGKEAFEKAKGMVCACEEGE